MRLNVTSWVAAIVAMAVASGIILAMDEGWLAVPLVVIFWLSYTSGYCDGFQAHADRS